MAQQAAVDALSPEAADAETAQDPHASLLDSLDEDDTVTEGAPRYRVPPRRLAAVEIPAVVNDIDRAVKAFGRVPSLAHVLDPIRRSLPLYLNPESPFCPPIASHNAASHNVLLKITIPKQTGRKRKRATSDPWQDDAGTRDACAAYASPNTVCSIARLDEPKVLRRKLEDNAGRYEVEAVGIIKQTHRFRGPADFYWDMSRSHFAQRYADQVLSGDVQQLKEFKLIPGVDRGPDVDIIPPPLFTHMTLPFNYNFSQNPLIRATDDGDTVNLGAVKQVGYLIGADDPCPTEPRYPPDLMDPRTMEVIAELEDAFDLRPVWTRRSLMNHLDGKLRNWNELKRYLNYTAYQFKGGPWRDSVVAYGIDPRTDPKYRIYQTLMFKMANWNHEAPAWRSLRKLQASSNKAWGPDGLQSHMFDGESYCTDGKVWQVCDISDPLLSGMLAAAAVRPTCDINSGWYHGGLWAKVKAIMKTKLVGIQFGRVLTHADFAATLSFGDQTPTRTHSSTFYLPLPNLGLTVDEQTALRGRAPAKRKSRGYNVRLRDLDKAVGAGGLANPSAPAAPVESNEADTEAMDLTGADPESGDWGAGGGGDNGNDTDDGEEGDGGVFNEQSTYGSGRNGLDDDDDAESEDDAEDDDDKSIGRDGGDGNEVNDSSGRNDGQALGNIVYVHEAKELKGKG